MLPDLKKMKTTLLALILGLGSLQGADITYLSINEGKKIELNERETDFVRENLLHIFDSSDFHQMKGGTLPVKTKEQLKELFQRVSSATHIELTLDEPARIVVENKILHVNKMWVRIRESDGFVYDWILETPDGELISLTKARGELVVGFAPYVLELLKNIEANQQEVIDP